VGVDPLLQGHRIQTQSCTATPAPNDAMEFASQASFLEKHAARRGGHLDLLHSRPKDAPLGSSNANAREAFLPLDVRLVDLRQKPQALRLASRACSWRFPSRSLFEHKIPHHTEAQREFLFKSKPRIDELTGQIPQCSARTDELNAIERMPSTQPGRRRASSTKRRAAETWPPFDTSNPCKPRLRGGADRRRAAAGACRCSCGACSMRRSTDPRSGAGEPSRTTHGRRRARW
jgi:hypothetical protein